jgi:hypothetical protein
MNRTMRRTRACTVETLDTKLRDAIRRHGAEYGLLDLETDVLMCCETLSVWQQTGFHGGIRTILSVIYVTPKWLVWADAGRDQDAMAGTAQLKHIDVRAVGGADGYSIFPDDGLQVSGRYTHKNSTGNTFLVLDSEAEGRMFRQVLQEALLASQRSRRYSRKAASHSLLLERDNRMSAEIKNR